MATLDDAAQAADEAAQTQPTATKTRKRRNPFSSRELKEEKERRQKKRARLIIRNISYKATEETLREHFSKFGTIEDLNLLKRSDGKLVGCAFVQYETVNQATKAILKGNNQPYLGRPVFVDWAMGKDEYLAKKGEVKQETTEPDEKKPKVEEIKDEDENKSLSNKDTANDKSDDHDDDDNDDDDDDDNSDSDDEEHSIKSENEEDDDEDEDDEDEFDDNEDDDDEDDDKNEDDSVSEDDKKFEKNKKNIDKVKKEEHISNDVQEGCTIFIKNVPFDASDVELRKVCRKYGPLYYAIINRERISGHSKGTAFVKFKAKESADLCLQAGTEFSLMDQALDPHPALSREEIQTQAEQKSKQDNKDSRNLYLAREGLIMSGSNAAIGVSANDMKQRHRLELMKTQMLKNLNRFVSRNRLSIHNLPLGYDNEKLQQMIIVYTGFKPHECRVMRENKITAEHPKGKSKGFGFMSFNTHQEALTALRKLNNNPKIFGDIHRPIVAFSIEDRTVHNIKEKRTEKSKLNNPTYQQKLQKRKEQRQQKQANGGISPLKLPKGPQSDDKAKLKQHIKKLEETRAAAKANADKTVPSEEFDSFVGMTGKPGTNIRMRSNKKISEQSQQHMKRVKTDKRKEKQRKIRQIHLAERKADVRPKQGRKVERDDLSQLVNKYKRMIDKSNAATVTATATTTATVAKQKKPKRTKWFKD